MKPYLVLIPLLMASIASASVQRSIIIEPYPREKLQQLERNVQAISGPAQELAVSLNELKTARQAQLANDTPATKAAVQQAMAVCFDRISRFTESARQSKTPLVLGFEDLADYMQINAMALKSRNGQNRETQRTADYMEGQARAIRQFAGDFEKMVTGMEEISQDLALRSSGWVASSRVAATLSDVYGQNGIEGVYGTMAEVVNAMTVLKQLFVTEDPIAGSFSSEQQQRDQEAARKTFEDAMQRYHNQP